MLALTGLFYHICRSLLTRTHTSGMGAGTRVGASADVGADVRVGV